MPVCDSLIDLVFDFYQYIISFVLLKIFHFFKKSTAFNYDMFCSINLSFVYTLSSIYTVKKIYFDCFDKVSFHRNEVIKVFKRKRSRES